MGFWDYLLDNQGELIASSQQHLLLVVQSVAIAAVLAVVTSALVYRNQRVTNFATGLSGVGLTIPSIALLGFFVTTPIGFGVAPSLIALIFYAMLPILRNAVVGLHNVDSAVIESARGMGMTKSRALVRIELPMAWPVILAGIRISTQMVMGIAAIAAYVDGPGLGSLIFSGLARIGGAGALNDVLAGTLGVVILAIVLDAILVLIGRLTIPRGIRG